jgi:hypothetical protein
MYDVVSTRHLEILARQSLTQRIGLLCIDLRISFFRNNIMTGKHLFEPGDFVLTSTGHSGLVISEKELQMIRKNYKEGNRPGRYFAPGCCQHPDYIIQIPVLFDDKTFDVMRAMNIRRTRDLSEEKQLYLKGLLTE